MKKNLSISSSQKELILPLHTQMGVLAVVEQVCQGNSLQGYRVIIWSKKIAIRLKDGGYYVILSKEGIQNKEMLATRFGNIFLEWLESIDELTGILEVPIDWKKQRVIIKSLSGYSTTEELKVFIRNQISNQLSD